MAATKPPPAPTVKVVAKVTLYYGGVKYPPGSTVDMAVTQAEEWKKRDIVADPPSDAVAAALAEKQAADAAEQQAANDLARAQRASGLPPTPPPEPAPSPAKPA